MRVVYLGTSDFAADVLERLASSRHDVALVVSQPDSRRGRGRRTAPPPVGEKAVELGLALDQPESVNGEAGSAAVLAAAPDALVVCAFGQLIAEPLLSSYELLNVHPSALPRWRGAAPIERAIMAGDATTAVAIMRLVRELDAGPVAVSATTEIGAREDFGSLAARLSALGAELLVSALDAAERGELEFRDQPADGVTYAAKIEAADRALDPWQTVAALDRRVRALHPHVLARLVPAAGDPIGVLEARPFAGEAAPPSGEIAERDGALVLGAADGGLELLVLKPAGGRAMPAADFLRGRELPRLG